MTANRRSRYWLEKLAHRKTGYPIATLAYYGPDDKFASKVVLGIFPIEGQKESELKKWFSSGTDVRVDPAINEEILERLQANGVVRTVTPDRIIGCPHEEGIDYPLGETCPQCPFWANRNRWTGELLK